MNQPKREPTPLRPVDRDMPNSVPVEQIVLGTLIAWPQRIEEVMAVLKPQDFYRDRHRKLYELMVDHYRRHGEGADFMTLAETLYGDKDLGADDLVELQYLSHEIPSFNLAQDLRLIAGTSAQRQHIAAGGQLAAIGYEIADADKARAKAEKILYDLVSAHSTESDFSSLDDVLADCMTDIENACKNRGKLLGVPTGFTDLDLMYNGLQRTDLILLAARPGFGKTSLGMGIAYNAARKGKTVAVFSLEMGKKQLGTRLLSLRARIASNRLRAGWLDEDEQQKVVDASDYLGTLPIYIDDTAGAPISSIASKLRRLSARIHRRVDLVVVDYLQLMEDDNESPSQRDNRNQELSRISRGLKLIAKQFDVPVLALAQLSRAVETRQNKIPLLSDLRDSGSLEQDADIVMFIYREEIYNPQTDRKGLADVVVAKHRNGPVGTVTLAFDASLTRFDNSIPGPEEDDTDDEKLD